jgi:hypothetical protein
MIAVMMKRSHSETWKSLEEKYNQHGRAAVVTRPPGCGGLCLRTVCDESWSFPGQEYEKRTLRNEYAEVRRKHSAKLLTQ